MIKSFFSNLEFPKNREKDYTKEYIQKRIEWLNKKTNLHLSHITNFSEDPENFKGNIENLIGCCQIPLGLAGPLKINGEYAKGTFYIPLATTEGTLVEAHRRTMMLATLAGGVNTKILKDELHISPAFKINNLNEADEFIKWINTNFYSIKREAENTTKHGKLSIIEPFIANRKVILKFVYNTADAQGMNMITKATEAACKFICKHTKKQYFLLSNFSSSKKVSMSNIHKGYGKAVIAETIFPKRLLKIAKVKAEEIMEYYNTALISGVYTGMIGMNVHIANTIAALFIACGQDLASIVNSHIGITTCDITPSGELYVSLYIPNLVVGTVGGGTGLSTQRECLEILGCYGPDKAKKFAEIVTAAALVSEISVPIALIRGTFVEIFEKYGRKPFQ